MPAITLLNNQERKEDMATLRTKRHVLFGCILLVLCAAASVSIVLGAEWLQNQQDALVIAQADPAMRSLAEQAGMNRTGELVFLRTHPQLADDTQMRTACDENAAANNQDGFIEQGCYNASTKRIYIRSMPSNLQSLEVATAAYEMLHPVYLALAKHDASSLNTLIEVNYRLYQTPDMATQVANFAKTEPGARDLELFSLIGTTNGTVTAPLATLYSLYFTDRAATIHATSQVTQLFHSYQDQLAQLKSQIATYDSRSQAAYAQSVTDARAGNASGNAYYYGQYKQDIAAENSVIMQYDAVVTSYNTLVTEYDGTQPVQRVSPAVSQ